MSKNQLKGQNVYFDLWFSRDKVHHMGEGAWHDSRNWRLTDHIFSFICRRQGNMITTKQWNMAYSTPGCAIIEKMTLGWIRKLAEQKDEAT